MTGSRINSQLSPTTFVKQDTQDRTHPFTRVAPESGTWRGISATTPSNLRQLSLGQTTETTQQMLANNQTLPTTQQKITIQHEFQQPTTGSSDALEQDFDAGAMKGPLFEAKSKHQFSGLFRQMKTRCQIQPADRTTGM